MGDHGEVLSYWVPFNIPPSGISRAGKINFILWSPTSLLHLRKGLAAHCILGSGGPNMKIGLYDGADTMPGYPGMAAVYYLLDFTY